MQNEKNPQIKSISCDPVNKYQNNPLNDRVQSVRKRILYAIGLIILLGLSKTIYIPGTEHIVKLTEKQYPIIFAIIFLSILYLLIELYGAWRNSYIQWDKEHKKEYDLFIQESLVCSKFLKEKFELNYEKETEVIKIKEIELLENEIENVNKKIEENNKRLEKLNNDRLKIESQLHIQKNEALSQQFSEESKNLEGKLKKIDEDIYELTQENVLFKKKIVDLKEKEVNDTVLREKAEKKVKDKYKNIFSDILPKLIGQLQLPGQKEGQDPVTLGLLIQIYETNNNYHKLLKKRLNTIIFRAHLPCLVSAILLVFSLIIPFKGLIKDDAKTTLETVRIAKTIIGYGKSLESELKKIDMKSKDASMLPGTFTDAFEILKHELKDQRLLLELLNSKTKLANLYTYNPTDYSLPEINGSPAFYLGQDTDGVLKLSYPVFERGEEKTVGSVSEWVKLNVDNIVKALKPCVGNTSQKPPWVHVVGYPDSMCFKDINGECAKDSKKRNIELANNRANTFRLLIAKSIKKLSAEGIVVTAKRWQGDECSDKTDAECYSEYLLMMQRAGFNDRPDRRDSEPAGLLNRRVDVYIMYAGQCSPPDILRQVFNVKIAQ